MLKATCFPTPASPEMPHQLSVCGQYVGGGQMVEHTSMNKAIRITLHYRKIYNSKKMFLCENGSFCDDCVFYSIGQHSLLARQPVVGQVLPPLVSGENDFCPLIFFQHPLLLPSMLFWYNLDIM
jgi:hypothetical protein